MFTQTVLSWSSKYSWKILKTSKKLSRSDNIFEFSSSKSNISLNVSFECRFIRLLNPPSTNFTSFFRFHVNRHVTSTHVGSCNWSCNTTHVGSMHQNDDNECLDRGLNYDCTTTIESPCSFIFEFLSELFYRTYNLSPVARTVFLFHTPLILCTFQPRDIYIRIFI